MTKARPSLWLGQTIEGKAKMDVRTLMHQAVINHGDRECVAHGERRLTFNEAWLRGVRLANALLAMNLQAGDRVGVLEDNSIEAADFFQGMAIDDDFLQ